MLFLLAGMALIFIFGKTQAQSDGANLFEKNCVVCHNLDDTRKVGPGLFGVTEKRDMDWLKRFIKSSTTMVQEGDPDAVAIWEEYNKVPMPNMPQLSEADIQAIIDYIAAYDPEAAAAEEQLVEVDTVFTELAAKKGEQLFIGAMEFENSKMTCTNCHNIKTTEEFSWYPSVYDIAKAYEAENISLFKRLNNPTSTMMKGAHRNSTYTKEEVHYLKAYLHHVSETGLAKTRRVPTKLFTFLALGLLMTLALIDLWFTKKIKWKVVHYLILLVGIAFQLKIVAHEAINLSRTQDYQPDQPIKFSHKVHATDNKIDCQYCHTTVETSKSAGIPGSDLCMNCHLTVREGTNSGQFEINKIYLSINNNQPIEWIKVHNLPDHVFFSHQQHVQVADIDCEKCHGKVEEMDVVKQVEDLSMGWCINCHRDTEVDFAGNEYYKHFEKLHDQLSKGDIKNVTADQTGGLDCMKCHY